MLRAKTASVHHSHLPMASSTHGKGIMSSLQTKEARGVPSEQEREREKTTNLKFPKQSAGGESRTNELVKLKKQCIENNKRTNVSLLSMV